MQIRTRHAAGQALALPLRRFLPAFHRQLDWRRWLASAVTQEVEQRRLFPWIAVFFSLGILLFFMADGRPSPWGPLLCTTLCGTGAVLARRSLKRMAVLIAATAVFAGFAASVLRARSVEAPVIARTVITPMTGYIEAIETRLGGARLLLRVTSMGQVPEEERPRRVRVTVRDPAGLAPGQFIAVKTRLLPPPQAAWPGGYDFARDAYFREIGGVGSLLGPIAKPEAPPGDLKLRIAAAVDAARNTLTRRIADAIGSPAGGVAAALVTGKRGLIEESTNEVLRAAGIYHIVSISGLHMVLAAGTFFWLARALLSLSPALALLWPVKKIAAVAAMVGAGAYCVFSGSEVATERSLIMTLVMFGAVLADRPALSIRNLSVAALIVLAREPEALIGPSFQMSFGAVAALIAAAPALRIPIREGGRPGLFDRFSGMALQGIVGLIGTTLVASLATAPFSAYHFQTLNPFGLIGNALALPLVSLVVMPAALLGVLAYPFGLDRPVWQIMGFAVSKVVDVSAWVSAFEGSSIVVPAIGSGAFACLSLAILLITLPASAFRWMAVAPAAAGLALALSPDRYDLFIDRDGAGAAVRGSGGKLVLVGKPSAFVIEQWLRADGDARLPDDANLRRSVRCDRAGCVVLRPDGSSVAFVQDAAAFEEDCSRAAVIVTPLTAPPSCKARLVIDRSVLRAKGAITAQIRGGIPTLRSSHGGAERRPWAAPLPVQVLPPTSVAPENRARHVQPVPEGDLPDDVFNTDEPG